MTFVPPSGSLDATWAVVGEAPGYNEMKEGRPFVGQSGQLMRKLMRDVGLDPDTAYWTNVVKEYHEGNPTPGIKAINAARPALIKELAVLPNLKGILLVGNVPLTAATGHGGITKSRGSLKATHPLWTLDVPAFATIHPAAVLRNQNYTHGFKSDLAAFRLLLDPPDTKKEIVRVLHPSPWPPGFWDDALVASRGAIDIETTADKETERFREGVQIISLAITFDGVKAYTFGFNTHNGGDWPIGDFTKLMDYIEQQRKTRVEWIMHNGYFDRSRLRLLGWDPQLTHDTMAMAYILDPDDRKGLEYLSATQLGEPPYKGVDYMNILEEPMDKILEMNGEDALRTFRLFRVLADRLNEQPRLSRIYQRILMPVVNTLVEVTENGVPLDLERHAELFRIVEQKQAAALELARTTAGNEALNLNSPLQLKKLWFEEWQLQPYKYTATGEPSTDGDTRKMILFTGHLTPVQRQHLEAVSEWKLLEKRRQYLATWLKFVDHDGYLHPTFKPLFVVTGRLSSQDPNIQQVPREKEYRAVFGGVPGWKWVKADYSQIELRIAAWVSGDPRLLAAYRKGEDIHRLTAKLVLGDDSDEARQNAKPINFGLLYGAWWKKLREIAFFDYNVSFSEVEAQSHWKRFFETYAGLRNWHKEQIKFMREHGYSVSPFGRIRYLPDLRSPDRMLAGSAEREGINHPIQSMASDLMLWSVSRIHQALDPQEARIVATVHDEVDLLVREDCVDKVTALVKEIMENPPLERVFGFSLSVPLVADVTVGTHWG